MAEKNDTETVESPPKRGKGGLLVWAAVTIAMTGLGFAIPFLFPTLFVASESQSAPTQEESNEPPAFVSFDETVVNLNSDRLNRYLRIVVTMQVKAGDADLVNEKLLQKKAILRSWLISHLADISMEDIRGAAGQNRLRREIQDQFNSILFEDGYDRIRDILFEEFNVQ